MARWARARSPGRFRFRQIGRPGLGRVLGVVGVVPGLICSRSHRGLVGKDEDVAEAAELLGDRRDVVIADQDVLVLFLDEFIAGQDNHFDDILAGRQHVPCRTGKASVVSGSCTQIVQLVPVGVAGRGVAARDAREWYMPSYGAGCSWFQLCMPS